MENLIEAEIAERMKKSGSKKRKLAARSVPGTPLARRAESAPFAKSAPKPTDANAAERASRKRGTAALVVLAFAAVYVIWGSTYLAIKYAIATLPPFSMAGARFMLAGAVLFGWSYARERRATGTFVWPNLVQWRTAAVVGALLLLCGNGGVTWAEGRIASGLAALLVATEPLWIVLLGWARPDGARPSGRVVAGLAGGFAGLALLVHAGTSAAPAAAGAERAFDLLGAFAVVVAAFAWAAGSLYSLGAPRPKSPSLNSGMQMLAGGAFLLLAGLLAGEPARFDAASVTPQSIAAFLYLVVFGSIVAFTAYTWLLRVVEPAKVATYAYVNPVVAIALGWAFAGETLGIQSLVAAAIVLASVVAIGSNDKPAKAENDAPAGAAPDDEAAGAHEGPEASADCVRACAARAS